ncbi:MAG: DNA replication/repair protein RecF [Actinomycetota bacterium]|nr:DNA replication/repair protein RecF [Actinomycetota bacterium]
MRLDYLWLVDFRNYTAAELSLPPGLTVVVGENGSGKTNLLEAVGYLATRASLRGASNDVLVRAGAPMAVVRGQGHRGERSLLIEAEIRPGGRGRITINRQPLRRSSDVTSALRVTVFSPDDLELVKAGPTGRRRYLDDLLGALHPRHDAARRDYERVVRQRNALLAQVGPTAGRHAALPEDVATTLEVWDARLVEAGEALGTARADLVSRLEPALAKAYSQLSDGGTVTIAYEAPWRETGLAAALRRARRDELRRGVSLVGPHRDELVLTIAGSVPERNAGSVPERNAGSVPQRYLALPARTHASQGEQRSLALALRLAGHDVVTEAVGEPPLLLLDDVFSELDASRSAALLSHLPGGQAILTTTGHLPEMVQPELTVRVQHGTLLV